MKKLLCISVLFMGGLTAFAQTPLDNYDAPSFAGSGNAGNLMHVITNGGTTNLNVGPYNVDSKDDRVECGYVEGHDLVASQGATVSFDIKVFTYWGRFAIFTDANESRSMERIVLLGNPGTTTFEGGSARTGSQVHVEDGTEDVDGTLPSITIPADATNGDVYLVRMIFFGANSGETESSWTYNHSYAEGQYYDFKVIVQDSSIELPKYAVTFPQSVEHGSFVVQENGVDIASGAEIEQGTRLTIVATPDAGYVTQIKINGELTDRDSFVVSEDVEIEVAFILTAPTFSKEGNVGNLMHVITEGASTNLNIGPYSYDSTEDRVECGYVDGHDIIAGCGTTVTFDIMLSTYWGRFAIFSNVNETATMERIVLLGNPGTTTFQGGEAKTGSQVHVEDGTNDVDGTLPSITIPANAVDGETFLVRMIFFGANSSETESDWTYNHTYAEGQYYDFIVKVDSTNGISEIAEGSASLYYAHNEIFAVAEGEIEIYNLTGSLVKRVYAASVAVDELPAGVYVARANGKTLKFVK